MDFSDIEIIYKLDESRNQRIIIFREDGSIEPLNIITSSNKNESYVHGIYLKKYLEKEYLEDEAIQNIRDKIIYSTRSVLYYLVNRYGNLIFAEITKDGNKKRSGIFFSPDELTQTQYDTLKEILPYFENFESILVQNCTSDDLATDFFDKSELKELDEKFKNLVNSKII